MRPMTITAAMLLAFAGAACSQETTEPADEAAPQVVPAAATDDDMGGFNLMIPGDDTTADDGYGGFNLQIPGDDSGGVLLPGSSITESTFGDLEPAAPISAPEVPAADDIIRIDPAD